MNAPRKRKNDYRYNDSPDLQDARVATWYFNELKALKQRAEGRMRERYEVLAGTLAALVVLWVLLTLFGASGSLLTVGYIISGAAVGAVGLYFLRQYDAQRADDALKDELRSLARTMDRDGVSLEELNAASLRLNDHPREDRRYDDDERRRYDDDERRRYDDDDDEDDYRRKSRKRRRKRFDFDLEDLFDD